MKYVFKPANPARCPSSVDPQAGRGVPMVAGQVYELTPEWAEHNIRMTPGVDGAPCLVPVDETPEKPAPAEKPAKGPKAGKPAVTPEPGTETT